MSNKPEMQNHTTRLSSLATVSFATLGCKTNQFESASMQELLQKAGYQVVPFDKAADLVIVNTCTVTNATDAQSRNLIRRARRLNGNCRVIVTGCYAQVDPGALQELPGVSMVIGNEEKQRLLDFLQAEHDSTRVEVSNIRESASVCLPPLTSFSGRSRAFVQIQNGCDAFCSYCIIPYARGASRSARPEDVVEQINGLVASGYREVVLTGIHIGGYGADLRPEFSLVELVRRIEDQAGIHRLRLGSIEPTELTDDLLTTIATSKVVCDHLHIPLQSGDDDVLMRMGRSYNTDYFARIIEKARSMLPDAAICLDVITGFPGESAKAASNTFDFIARLPITDLHVFPYSKRPGTPAASMPGHVPGNISKERAEALRSLADEKRACFASRFIGRELEVVVEHSSQGATMKGITRNYLDIHFAGRQDLVGQSILVKPTTWKNNVLLADLVD